MLAGTLDASAAGVAYPVTIGPVLGRLKDQGIMQPTQVSVAKWHNARAAIEVARDAGDVLGGAGISVEYSPIRHALNLESVITYEGTETVHQWTVGRALTGINAF